MLHGRTAQRAIARLVVRRRAGRRVASGRGWFVGRAAVARRRERHRQQQQPAAREAHVRHRAQRAAGRRLLAHAWLLVATFGRCCGGDPPQRAVAAHTQPSAERTHAGGLHIGRRSWRQEWCRVAAEARQEEADGEQAARAFFRTPRTRPTTHPRVSEGRRQALGVPHGVAGASVVRDERRAVLKAGARATAERSAVQNEARVGIRALGQHACEETPLAGTPGTHARVAEEHVPEAATRRASQPQPSRVERR